MKKPKHKRRSKRPVKFPIHPSIRSLAAALHVPPNAIREAKRVGRDGFDAGGRIDTGKLFASLLMDGTVATDALSLARTRLTSARAVALEREDRTRHGGVVPAGFAIKTFGEALEFFDAQLEKAGSDFLIASQGISVFDRDELARLLRGSMSEIRTTIDHARRKFERLMCEGPNGDNQTVLASELAALKNLAARFHEGRAGLLAKVPDPHREVVSEFLDATIDSLVAYTTAADSK